MTEYTTPHAVTAAKITALQGPRSTSDNYEVTLDGVGPVLMSYRDFVDRHHVEVGGYWLEYADGSIGYLPGETFEALYEAVEALKVVPVAEAAPVVVEAPVVAEVAPAAPVETKPEESARESP